MLWSAWLSVKENVVSLKGCGITVAILSLESLWGGMKPSCRLSFFHVCLNPKHAKIGKETWRKWGCQKRPLHDIGRPVRHELAMVYSAPKIASRTLSCRARGTAPASQVVSVVLHMALGKLLLEQYYLALWVLLKGRGASLSLFYNWGTRCREVKWLVQSQGT